MAESFVLGLVLMTTLLAIVVGGRALGLRPGQLGAAAGSALEAIGFMVVFGAINLVIGPAVLLLARFLTGQFVSLYYADDSVLLICSCVQGLVFQRWWESRRNSPRR